MSDNAGIAADLRAYFREHGIVCLNILSSPGAGKTSLLEQTLQAMIGGGHRVLVLTGDSRAERDAERLARFGFPVRQVATGGRCRLDARLVREILGAVSLEGLDLLFIENVGNPECAAALDLGEAAKVVMLSVAEGADKPLKYPALFSRARLMLLHKVDLLPYTRFDVPAAKAEVRRVNPTIEIIETSCVGAPGLKGWLAWIEGLVTDANPAGAGL